MFDFENPYTVSILVKSDRPDFRLFSVFLWGDNVSTDSDGNSYPASSRTWTELWMSNRDLPGSGFEILQSDEDSQLFNVTSDDAVISNRAAFFLAKETNGRILGKDILSSLDFDLGDDFDLETAIQRAENSIWRKATLQNPYPNLQAKH